MTAIPRSDSPLSLGDATYDACVIGAGPNGLAAAVELAQKGARVIVVEAHHQIGGGTRTAELTLPGFHHDVCSAVHPTGILSPFFRSLPLQDHGLQWLKAGVSVAHPLDQEPAVLLKEGLEETASELGRDEHAYRRLLRPFLNDPHALFRDAFAPLGWPERPLQMLRFGWNGFRSAQGLAHARFNEPRAKALLAGCAAHSTLRLEQSLSAAVGLLFLITGHVERWPVAQGGSVAITNALASYFQHLGGEIVSGLHITRLDQLPACRAYLFDTTPQQLVDIAGSVLPNAYKTHLEAFRYGPGVFKVDWALDGPIPWQDPRCGEASTVHLGGPIEQVAAAEAQVWEGEHPLRPFVLLCQQSHFDSTRAPAGQHTGYAYCHVPADSSFDMTERIEQQVERFAPGFRQLILARHTMNTAAFSAYNTNYIGGSISGGVSDLRQAFLRPVPRLDPYSTPNPRVFICSSSTPPGGGVHGMCGFHAAQSAHRALERFSCQPL